MTFDPKLATRIRKELGKRTGLVEKQMFGGIAFLLRGNMCVGVSGKEMIVRIPPEDTDRILAQPNTRIFDLSGRPMKGWILVKPKGLATPAGLKKWIGVAVTYAGSLPAK
jgi:TfoX-like protein